MDTRYLATVISGCLVVLLVFMAAMQAQSRYAMGMAIFSSMFGWFANAAAELDNGVLHKSAGALSVICVLAAIWML